MGGDTKIEWAEHTFNPWEGCQKVGPGCDNCYAEARDIRFTGGTHWGPGAPRRRTSAANWAKPLKWNRDAAKTGTRPRVFCASLADVFDNAVDPAWRADLWALIWSTPHLDWLLLTKRPGNIAAMIPQGVDWGAGWVNVWLGCTVVNQAEADRDIPKLLAVPAHRRFLSIEPMLGPIDLTNLDPHGDFRPYGAHGWSAIWRGNGIGRACLDWVVCGGESGPNARPMHPDWARSLRDQCRTAGVAFHFKQWGEWEADEIGPEDARSTQFPPGHVIFRKIGKAATGRKLDGRTWDEVPS